MADYYPLIARAIAGLDKNTGDARRALYERARTALVAQLRGIDPPLQESEITRERLALEEAIRKVEAEAARRSRGEPGQPAGTPPSGDKPAGSGDKPATPQSGASIPPAAGGAPQAPVMPPAGPPSAPRYPNAAGAPQARAPGKPADAPLPPVAKAPGDVAKHGPQQPAGPAMPKAVAPKSSPFDVEPAPPIRPRPMRDPFANLPRTHDFEQTMEPKLAQEDFNREHRPPGRDDGLVQDMGSFGDSPSPLRGRSHDADEDLPPQRKARSLGGLIKIAAVAVVLLAIAGVLYMQRGAISGLWSSGSSQVASKSEPQPQSQSQGRPKITDRLGGQNGATGPAVAQRVVLYEEDPNDPQGKRFIGSAIWRTETVSPGSGRPPELAIRADVEIPERRMTMNFSIRRNLDQTLPASHTIEVMFNLPADFPSGGIQNVPGVLMKQAEQTRGTPLAGLAVKVTNNFFLIGLSAVESDQARNIQLLKERSWFDIPIVYNNNRRAILAIEKGTPGERGFAEAFETWKQ